MKVYPADPMCAPITCLIQACKVSGDLEIRNARITRGECGLVRTKLPARKHKLY
jgi:hypothetical protein